MVVPMAPSMMAMRFFRTSCSGCSCAVVMAIGCPLSTAGCGLARIVTGRAVAGSTIGVAAQGMGLSSLCEYASFVLFRRDGVWHSRRRHQQVFLAHDQRGRVERSEFEA